MDIPVRTLDTATKHIIYATNVHVLLSSTRVVISVPRFNDKTITGTTSNVLLFSRLPRLRLLVHIQFVIQCHYRYFTHIIAAAKIISVYVNFYVFRIVFFHT